MRAAHFLPFFRHALRLRPSTLDLGPPTFASQFQLSAFNFQLFHFPRHTGQPPVPTCQRSFKPRPAGCARPARAGSSHACRSVSSPHQHAPTNPGRSGCPPRPPAGFLRCGGHQLNVLASLARTGGRLKVRGGNQPAAATRERTAFGLRCSAFGVRCSVFADRQPHF